MSDITKTKLFQSFVDFLIFYVENVYVAAHTKHELQDVRMKAAIFGVTDVLVRSVGSVLPFVGNDPLKVNSYIALASMALSTFYDVSKTKKSMKVALLDNGLFNGLGLASNYLLQVNVFKDN